MGEEDERKFDKKKAKEPDFGYTELKKGLIDKEKTKKKPQTDND